MIRIALSMFDHFWAVVRAVVRVGGEPSRGATRAASPAYVVVRRPRRP